MSVIKKCFLGFAVMLFAAEVWGQAAPSPFTDFGIGDAYGNSLIHNQGAGGIGVSHPQLWYLNNQNPALLVFNPYTVFQVGTIYESRTVESATTKDKNTGGNLNYLAIAFPIKLTKWTTSAGLMPYTHVNYNFAFPQQIKDPDGQVVDTATVRQSATGGLTQLYWSNGVRLTKSISVGLKSTYLFGPVDNIYSNVINNVSSGAVPYIVSIEEKTNVNGFNFGVGLSFSKDSLGARNNKRFSLGAVYNFSSKLKGKINRQISRTTIAEDTVERYPLSVATGKVEMPSSFTVGVSYGKGAQWMIGTEFTYQDWSSFKSVNQDDEGLGESWRAAFGGEYTVDPNALENYLKRITFRAGLSLERYPFSANNKPVDDFGINFGMSLPAGRSSVDLAFKFGKRGNKDENILEESYFKIFFGLTFNDQWFIKRKFD
jgi:long-subunit fatty acid transport protein